MSSIARYLVLLLFVAAISTSVPAKPIKGVVVDSLDVEMGLFQTDLSGNACVLMKLGPDPICLAVVGRVFAGDGGDWYDTVNFVANSERSVFFEGENCTGQSYLPSYSYVGLAPWSALADRHGVAVVYIGKAVAPKAHAISSISSGPGQCTPASRNEYLVPVVRIVDLATLYTPPYKLK